MLRVMFFSTLSNYILLVLKIALSLVLVRVMFLGISNEEYGFWALLWTIFGYSLLLDFGFGTAIQKETSKAFAKNDWKEYNKIVSTIFFSYLLLSSVIIITTIILSFNLEKIFAFSSSSDIKYYQNVFMIFGIGTALVFPFGFFKEVLRGLQKITIRNFVDMIFLILNFILLVLCVHFELSLIYMAVVAVCIQLFTNIFMGVYVYKNIPNLKISISLFEKKRIKELMSFSFFAYIVMFSNLIIFRTDQLVISIYSTVSLVAIYQIVSRISEIFRQFSTQIHDILAPISASLFTVNEDEKLKSVLLHTNNIVGFISSLLLIPLYLFIDELLYFWLDIKDEQASNTALILLVSMYILVFLRSSSVQVLLMCERHKELTYIAILEAILNLVLSIYLISKYSIIGVALGTLIPNLLLAIFYNIPVACKFSKVSILSYLNQAVFKTIALLVVQIYVFKTFIIKDEIDSFLELIFYSISSCLVFCLFYYFICIPKTVKNYLNTSIKKLITDKLKYFKVNNV